MRRRQILATAAGGGFSVAADSEYQKVCTEFDADAGIAASISHAILRPGASSDIR